jgi:dipeptidyl aminopeptidase/acylaminoacyl peptidase
VNVRSELSRLDVPDQPGAQARAWEVVRSAYREQSPVQKRRSHWRLALAPAMTAVAAAFILTPAGATVGRLIKHALGVPHPARALFSLPSAGRVLVSGAGGTWIVSADGSRRRVGSWQQASWSPHGIYIAVAGPDELAAINPRGVTQWALARRAVSDPRWYPPSGFRVAYRSGSELRVVAGDGIGDHLLATGVAPVAPAWRPNHPYQLAYVQRGRLIIRDADSGRVIWSRPVVGASELGWSADGSRLLMLTRSSVRVLTSAGRPVTRIQVTPDQAVTDASLSPNGRALAIVRGGAAAGVQVARLGSSRPVMRNVLTGPGVRSVAWSPDGRWLLASWPAANQWVFVAADGAPHLAAVSRIAQQFAGGRAAPGAPRVEGWCCTAQGPAG